MQPEPSRLSYVRALPPAPKLALGAQICLLLGLAILVIGLLSVDVKEPHLWGPLNDQIAYINVARSLLTKGTLQSNTILPSTLWQKATSDVLYMPGHPAAIALSYRLFGFGWFQSIIPSLVSYLIAMLAIYFIGARCYSPTVGLIASLLFALFPPVLFFAFTAMAELTFLAAFTAAVCACLYLPHRLRPWLGPVCLAVPFLFRETAALMAVPLGLYFWLDRQDKRAWRSVAFVALSVVILVVVFRSDLSTGRPSLVKANIFGDWHAVYDDAPAQQAAATTGWRDWLRVLPGRTLLNVKFLFSNPDFAPWVNGGNYTMMAAMALVGLAAVWRRDRFAWTLSLLNAVAVTASVVMVSVSGYRGIRHLMFTYALNVVVIALLLVKSSSRISDFRPLILAVTASAAGAVVSLYSLGVVRDFYAVLANQDLMDRGRVTTLVTIGYALAAAVGLIVVWRHYKRRRANAPLESKAAIINPLLYFRSFSVLSIVAGTALVVLFSASGYRSMRYLLFAYALSVVVIFWLLAKLTLRITARKQIVAAGGLTAAALLLFSFGVVRNMFTFYTDQDEVDRRYAATLETLGIDNNRMLVTPFEWSTRYRYDHFPVPWAFLPNNKPTLDLLAARFDIGTLILKTDHPLLKDPATLAEFGFYKERELALNDINYSVYKRPGR